MFSAGPQTPSDISYSPASVRSSSHPNTGEWSLSSPTSSHARMNWVSEPDSQPLNAAVVESFAHISNEMGGTDLNQILALDESLFEGQSPAPFTPLPSPAPSPKLSLAGIPHARQPRNIATMRPHQAFTPQHPLRATAAPTEAVNTTESRNGMFSNTYFSGQVSQEQPDSFESPRKKRYREKEELELRQRLEDFNSKFGSNHPATLDTMLRLAGVLSHQGRLRSAEALFKGVAEIQYSISGQDDLGTINAFVSLANNYIKQSKLSTAEKLLRWLHSKVPSVVSMSSPLNLQIKNILGRCLYMLSIRQEAEQLLRESIRIGGHVLKADDNLLLEPMEYLAQILVSRGEFTEAEKMLLAIVQAHDGLRGSADINTLDSRSALGNLYRMQGDFRKSEEILRQVLSDQERILGPEHESTLWTQRSLSSALSGQEKYQECEVLIKDAFEKFKKTLGRKHMNTLDCEIEIATTADNQQKYEEAEVIAKNVLAFSEEVLGFDHNISFHALYELGRSYEGQNRLQEALSIYGEAVERSTRSAGAEHPQTILSRNCVVRVQQNIDRSLTLPPTLGGLWTPSGNGNWAQDEDEDLWRAGRRGEQKTSRSLVLDGRGDFDPSAWL